LDISIGNTNDYIYTYNQFIEKPGKGLLGIIHPE